jgi:hypothetical protein
MDGLGCRRRAGALPLQAIPKREQAAFLPASFFIHYQVVPKQRADRSETFLLEPEFPHKLLIGLISKTKVCYPHGLP